MPNQNVDPVSGNEIPPGAEAEEVRDDIDAKLSKNEYVIPADVVRYFGTAHFEKLINKAKEGMLEMEEAGRMGGEAAPDDTDDLPFSDEELMTVDDEAPMEMAEGGLVSPQGSDAVYNNPQISNPFFFNSTPGGIGGGQLETRMYINSDGHRRAIMFMDGTPLQAVPDGYVVDNRENRDLFEQTEEAVTEAIDQTEGQTSAEQEGNRSVADYSGMSDAQIAADVAIGKAFGGVLGGAFAGPVGSRVGRSVVSRSIADEMEAQGLSPEAIAEALGTDDKDSKSLGDKLGSTLSGLFGSNKSKTTDDADAPPDFSIDFLSDLQSAINAPAPSVSASPSASSGDSAASGGYDAGSDFSGGSHGGGTYGGDTGSEPDPSRGGGYMNKGGLVSRKKRAPNKRRKAVKKKGLGSKR